VIAAMLEKKAMLETGVRKGKKENRVQTVIRRQKILPLSLLYLL
jgi:hypothetical protein